MADKKSRISCREEAKVNSILMGEHSLENSTAEKYHGDQISEKGTAASITETINIIKKIMALAENPCLMGRKTAMAAIIKF